MSTRTRSSQPGEELRASGRLPNFFRLYLNPYVGADLLIA